MSLINQVLSDLEKRGTPALPGEPAIRPVAVQPVRRRLLPLLVLLVAVLAAAGWWSLRGQAVAPQAVQASPAPDGIPAPVVQPANPVPSQTPEPERLASGAGAPSLLLSFELSSIPLPSTLRTGTPRDLAPPKEIVPPKESPPPVKPVQPAAAVPVISGVSPNPAPAMRGPQPLTISGSNFAPGAKVTLRSGGKEYANRPVSSWSTVQIVINPNLGAAPGKWEVEVVNPGGAASGAYAFNVQPSPPGSPAPSPQAAAPAGSPAQPTVARVDKQLKQVSVQQLAENEFRQANGLMRQGRINEAISGYESALQLDADHESARQALAGLLLESKRNADAERALQEGLQRNPGHSGFAMLLARLQVERKALTQALETLQKTLPYAGQKADFRAFTAAILQRLGQHQEAVAHYQAALQMSPDSGVWLMGLGISLQVLQRNDEARAAFRRALETRSLNAELQDFIAQRLKEL